VRNPHVMERIPTEILRGSLSSFMATKAGNPVIRLPEIVIRAASKIAPPSNKLNGVQFRLNALGFGAGHEDNKMGPHTQRAVRHFQRTYGPLTVDGVPGPKTVAKLVHVCGF
jgi:N-acetyl-anhydromuramyl-L-alanine amidase AmpD